MLRTTSTDLIMVCACVLNDRHIAAVGITQILGSGTSICEMELRWEMIRKLAASKRLVAASCTLVILLCQYKSLLADNSTALLCL
jgi:hypothetical protein